MQKDSDRTAQKRANDGRICFVALGPWSSWERNCQLNNCNCTLTLATSDSPSNKKLGQLKHLHVHHPGLTPLVLDNLLRHHGLPAILVGFSHLFLQVHDGLGWVKTLWAAVGAVHDAMAAVQLHGVVDPCQTLFRELIPRVSNPSVSLHQHCWAQVIFRIPPVRWARRHAASAKNALVHSIQLCTILTTLEVFFFTLALHVLALQPRLDGLVLVVEVGQVRNQILHDVSVRQWLDLDGLATFFNV